MWSQLEMSRRRLDVGVFYVRESTQAGLMDTSFRPRVSIGPTSRVLEAEISTHKDEADLISKFHLSL